MFVDILRKNLKLYDIDEAVKITVEYCIEEEMKKIGDDRYEQISQILELPLEKVKDYVNEKSEMVK